MNAVGEYSRNKERKMTLTVAPPHVFPATNRLGTGTLPPVLECTVSQAATLLDVPEGFVNELLNANRVLFRLENGERLIDKNYLLNYWQERERRHAALDEMVRLDQEMGLYDD
jgi:hypothetical protein